MTTYQRINSSILALSCNLCISLYTEIKPWIKEPYKYLDVQNYTDLPVCLRMSFMLHYTTFLLNILFLLVHGFFSGGV